MEDELFFTPEEIAEKMKLKKATVYEMIKRGDLEAHRIGGKNLRISKSQFESYLYKSKGLDNTYKAEIFQGDNEIFAMIDGVKIYVATEMRGLAHIGFRSEDIILSSTYLETSARNVLEGKVVRLEEKQGIIRVTLDVGIPIVAKITHKSMENLKIELGTVLFAIFKTVAVRVFK